MKKEAFLSQLLSLPTVTDSLMSPDGRWLAFTWYHRHENADIFLVPSDGSANPIALTHTPEYTELVSWSLDSLAVIIAEDHDGDELACLYRIDLNLDDDGTSKPGKPIALTEERPAYFIRGGYLSPQDNVIYYGANYDFEKAQVIEATWLYRQDLKTGERRAIARPQRPAYMGMALNRAGTHLIYTCKDRHPSGVQVHLVDVEGKEDREILHFGDRTKTYAHWLPDSQQLLVISQATERTAQSGQEHYSLGVYHWPSGSMRWLVDDPARSIENAWVSPDGAIIVDNVQDGGHTPSFFPPLDPSWAAGKTNPPPEMPFPKVSGNLLPLGRTADGAWAATYYSSTSPIELVRFTVQGEDLQPSLSSLTRVWEHSTLDASQLTPAESFRWSSVDGLSIHGWLYRAQPNPHRAVIYIHGGPTYHSEDRLNAQIQYLVSQGFNVLDVNYRGSTGYGLKYREMIKEDGWGGREQADIASGAQALIKNGLAKPGKVGVTGTSYGGYSSWFLLTHFPPETIGAAAPICGMTDLVVDYETTRPDLRPYSEEMIGGSPQQAPERYYERSPIHFVQNIRGSLLIVQGGQDPNVTPENVRQVVARLDKHSLPYETLVFDDEGHGIAKAANQEKLYTRLASFFDNALD